MSHLVILPVLIPLAAAALLLLAGRAGRGVERAIALAAAAVALLAWYGDRRRMKRSDPDAFGWMPWTAVSFWASAATFVFGVLALREWIVG